jgi:hypothetical protein
MSPYRRGQAARATRPRLADRPGWSAITRPPAGPAVGATASPAPVTRRSDLAYPAQQAGRVATELNSDEREGHDEQQGDRRCKDGGNEDIAPPWRPPRLCPVVQRPEGNRENARPDERRQVVPQRPYPKSDQGHGERHAHDLLGGRGGGLDAALFGHCRTRIVASCLSTRWSAAWNIARVALHPRDSQRLSTALIRQIRLPTSSATSRAPR